MAASAWGRAWGAAFGSAWGAITAGPSPAPVQAADGFIGVVSDDRSRRGRFPGLPRRRTRRRRENEDVIAIF